jgi:hypothetical protein
MQQTVVSGTLDLVRKYLKIHVPETSKEKKININFSSN